LLQFGASNFKVFKVDEDLYDLAKILRAQLFNERFADLLGQKLVKRLKSTILAS
jgi:ribosomal protein L29